MILVACGNKEETKQNQEPEKSEQATADQSSVSEVAKAKNDYSSTSRYFIAAPLYKMIDDESLLEGAEDVEFLTWNTPDELRARISGGQVQVSAVPTYVGANLYNKGVDIQLVNTLIWGFYISLVQKVKQ